MVWSRSGDPTATVQDIPPELIDRFCIYADVETLKTLRLVTKNFGNPATKALFKHLEVLPTEESVQKYLQIKADPEKSALVNSIAFNTSLYPSSDASDEEAHEALVYDEENYEYHHIHSFVEALSTTAAFSKLQSLAVNFSERCVGGSWDFNEAPEDVEIRSRILESLVQGFQDNKPPVKFHHLAFRNLQNKLPGNFVQSTGFKAMMSNVNSLSLQIATETDDAAPESDIRFPELHSFFAGELQTYFLTPLQPQLRELKLYTTLHEWGYYPFLDLRDPNLVFPKLEVLALGNFTFAFDWQLDWIFSHASTLKNLAFDDCPILYAGRTDEEDMGYKHETPSVLVKQGQQIIWSYASRWHNYFNRIRDNMTQLRHFHMSDSDGGANESGGFEDINQLGADLTVCRYGIYDIGIGPTQFLDVHYPDQYEKDRNYEGKLAQIECDWADEMAEEEDVEGNLEMVKEAVKFPDCFEEDQRALDELMEVVSARR